jgi:hypothetical protein
MAFPCYAQTPLPVHPGYKALPRPISYSMPLAPRSGAKAVIVYGKQAAWTQAAAAAVQKAIRDWSGVTLELADDRTVTSDETWLLADSWRKTPLIVLGNAQDNRLMHALGTRCLLQSNRTWPGGDRFVIRSVFEPFVADVNYVVLEASNQMGMNAAIARFADLLKTFGEQAKSTATIPPRVRVVGCVKDRWEPRAPEWKPPAEWAGMGDREVPELIAAFKGKPLLAGTPAGNERVTSDIWWHANGGQNWGPEPIRCDLDLAGEKAIAAMTVMGCRAIGGRTHGYFDHYGALGSFNGIRAIFNSAILSPQEVAELESCIVLSSTVPLDYVYNNIGGDVGWSWGDRHCLASLLFQLHALDYVAAHCRMDDKTRKEVERRYDAACRSTSRYVRSFRDNDESDCLGEDTLMQVSCVLHQGLMDNIRNGNLRRSADLYIMSVDNLPARWGQHGNYVGLAGFSGGRGAMYSSFFGGGLVDEAAFYYDDPQFRWLGQNWADIKWSRGGGYLLFHGDTVGQAVKPVVPATCDGVRALPFDERLYAVLKDRNPYFHSGGGDDLRPPPEPFEKAADRVVFRDGFDAQQAFLFLATFQPMRVGKYVQNNSIARFTDLGNLWLYTNTESPTGWSRNLMSVSNGKSHIPRAGCTVEALCNLGELSAVSSKEEGLAGTDWTRTIVHWRGHYFVVLDHMRALQDDEYAYVCRWRTTQLASLRKGIWLATAPDGGTMRIQNTDPLFQTSEYRECDGAARPYVLQQHKQAKLAKGQVQTMQNLMYVSGAGRRDEFEARRVGPEAVLVRGRTGGGAQAAPGGPVASHLALIGTGGQIPLATFQTDATIYDLFGDKLHLAGATTLKVRIGEEMREIFWAPQPVNVLVDCQTGKGEVEIRGEHALQVKTGDTWGSRKPGRQAAVFAHAGALPKVGDQLEAMWSRSKAPGDMAGPATAGGQQVFQVKRAPTTFQRPLRKLTNANITATPAWGLDGGSRSWSHTDNLEITLSLPQSTPLGCLRVVGIMKRPEPVVGRNPTQGEAWGSAGKFYQEGDFKFSLVLSDDGFQKDIRQIESPTVRFEETLEFASMHCGQDRLPTWRIGIGRKARQLKLLPRATTKERARLIVRDLELYEDQCVDELTAKAIIADIDGDGAGELIVGTSQKELAALDAEGNCLWHKDCPGDVVKLDAADLDESGRFQPLVLLGTERLVRLDADGSERPGGDLYKAQCAAYHGCAGATGVIGLSAWGPDDPKKKEVILHSCGPFRVLADGSMKQIPKCMGFAQASARLVNLYPGEREVLATVDSQGTRLWSPHRDAEGNYPALGSVNVAGFDGGERGGFGYVRAIDVPPFKGCVSAIPSGINYFPIDAFMAGSKEKGWSFSTGGAPAVAALVEDVRGDGVPQVFLARLDGFVNVLKLADGSSLGLLNTGEPILGMALLRGKDGKPRLAVGTKFAVHLFGNDLKGIGRHVLPTAAAAFAGPGGKNKDRTYVIDTAGKVTVLIIDRGNHVH